MVTAMLRFQILAPIMVLALAACHGGDKAEDPIANRDPAVNGALNDPIMADPDLAAQNRGNTALSGGGPAEGEVPPDKLTPEEAAAARAAARVLLGGNIAPAPSAQRSAEISRLAQAVTAQMVVEASGLGGPGCAARLEYGFVWAARLPAALPVYPRGHALWAGGSDMAGCKLRVVRFLTPVSPIDVTDFYYGVAKAKGLAPLVSREGQDQVVSGRGYSVFARPRGDHASEVDLVTAGL